MYTFFIQNVYIKNLVVNRRFLTVYMYLQDCTQACIHSLLKCIHLLQQMFTCIFCMYTLNVKIDAFNEGMYTFIL